MFTFKSPAQQNNIWKLCFKDRDEMLNIYYEKRTPEEGVRVYGVTDYISSTIFLDRELDGWMLGKVLRHELGHAYLWETGNQGHTYDEEEMVDFMSVAGPAICKTADDIMLRLREGLYKRGE